MGADVIATTRGALIRGTSTEDGFGDETESVEVVEGFESFPLGLIEKDRREWDPSTNTARTVRVAIGRVSSRIPIQVGDRIKDLRDGAIYELDGDYTRTPRTLSGRASVTLKLKRTTPSTG